MLRWIDELNGISDADARARQIKADIRRIRKSPPETNAKRALKQLYRDLDALQFKPDYMCLIIDKHKDYYRACRGFSINGVRYKRLLGTNGGIKNSTIVFVSERLHAELSRRVENGRDPCKELVTAKLEAYKALTCSASIPVSFPKGVLIVNDAETEFTSEVMALTDEGEAEPTLTRVGSAQIRLNASDGFGLMLPSLAERWSAELGLGYNTCGCNTRFAFEKGMVFTFDFIDFAEKKAGTYIVRDAWGDEVDVRSVELILTTSMVKLWDSYGSCGDYIDRSLDNGYSFGIAKTCPETLENQRALNYQFIQSYELTDADIDELAAPTMNEFSDVLSNDWRKTVLFLKGSGLTAGNVERLENDYIKGLMIDKRLLNDPYVQSNIYRLIKNRIDEAKVGVLNVHANYSIVSGDPYLLCQSVFGLEKTGLLRAGEIYNAYWAYKNGEKIVCFRAPMTCHNNIRAVRPVDSEEARYWYKHLTASTVFNAWDTASMALNGCDYDGDLVMLTDNPVMVERMRELPALMCVQRKAKKKISCEDDFITSNIESFGNEIGQTTNWITSMFEVQARYEPGTPEYEALDYRIKCGQLYQQNAIDKAKGIICKPMPKSWHDRHAVNKIEDESVREFYRSVVADKKPYFMRYIYPPLMKQYNSFLRNTNCNAVREFQMTVDELKQIPADALTERQADFLKYCEYRTPVGMSRCVMNRICRRFEERFDGYFAKRTPDEPFDYTIMKSGAEYTPNQFAAIKKLYNNYNQRLRSYSAFADCERVDEYEAAAAFAVMNDEFMRECSVVCPDRSALCNIVLDICYTRSVTKRFAWNMCGEEIIRNLLAKNGGMISFPSPDPDGDINYCGSSYSMQTKIITEETE